MSFADFIKNYISAKDLSIRAMADICNISHTEVSRLKKGKTPSIQTIKKISRGTGISEFELLKKAGVIKQDNKANDKIYQAISDDPELMEFWSELEKRDDLQLLFKQTRDLSPKAVRQIIRIIKAIEDEEEESHN